MMVNEVLIQIGGTVFDPSGNPVKAAWVRLESAVGETLKPTQTDEDGHFIFSWLQMGDYTLQVRAAGFREEVKTISVPSDDGHYDVELTPLP